MRVSSTQIVYSTAISSTSPCKAINKDKSCISCLPCQVLFREGQSIWLCASNYLGCLGERALVEPYCRSFVVLTASPAGQEGYSKAHTCTPATPAAIAQLPTYGAQFSVSSGRLIPTPASPAMPQIPPTHSQALSQLPGPLQKVETSLTQAAGCAVFL